MTSSNRRERQLARERDARRALRRVEREQRRRRRNALVASLLAVALLAGVAGFTVLQVLGSDELAPAADPAGDSADPAADQAPDQAPDQAATPPSAADAERPVACGAEAPPAPEPQSYDAEPPLALEPGADYVMTVVTSCGEVVVDLFEEAAPRTVSSFRFLAERDFFDGAPVSRLTGEDDGFVVVQAGDQEGTGAGGPGYVLPDEALDGAAYTRGTVALANAGPGTGGSQFFLVAQDTERLAPAYTPFGQVESGLDVVDRIVALGHDGSNPAGGGRPAERVYLEDVTVSTR